mgnify:CR=1 FL=1
MFLQGIGYDFVLEYNYDVWSFGMLAYELASGQPYFSGLFKSPTQIMKRLGDPEFVPPEVDGVIEDSRLQNLIKSCLQIDPKRRIRVSQILRHPYFR